MLDAFDNTESALLVEPSLSRKSDRPPDLVLIDPEVGVHVIEVKAFDLDRHQRHRARRGAADPLPGRRARRNAIAQVLLGDVLDIKRRDWPRVRDRRRAGRSRSSTGSLFPLIHRAEWLARFGRDAYCPPELLFAEDLEHTRASYSGGWPRYALGMGALCRREPATEVKGL